MHIDDRFAPPAPCLTDRTAVADADALIATFGEDACFEASARADRSRSQGNAIHFARWREIERLIAFLSGEAAVGTVH